MTLHRFMDLADFSREEVEDLIRLGQKLDDRGDLVAVIQALRPVGIRDRGVTKGGHRL